MEWLEYKEMTKQAFSQVVMIRAAIDSSIMELGIKYLYWSHTIAVYFDCQVKM